MAKDSVIWMPVFLFDVEEAPEGALFGVVGAGGVAGGGADAAVFFVDEVGCPG